MARLMTSWRSSRLLARPCRGGAGCPGYAQREQPDRNLFVGRWGGGGAGVLVGGGERM